MNAPSGSTAVAAAAATASKGSKELARHLQGHAFTALWIGAAAVAVLVLLVWVAAWYMARQKNSPSEVRLEPLGIPRGSVRSMLGLLIVGGFVDFLLFGRGSFGADPQLFNTVLAAFGTLTGAVTGFYFGHRATVPPRTTPGSVQQGKGEAGPPDDRQG